MVEGETYVTRGRRVHALFDGVVNSRSRGKCCTSCVGCPSCELRTQPAAGFVHIALVGFVPLFFRPPFTLNTYYRGHPSSSLQDLSLTPHFIITVACSFSLYLVSLLFHSHLYFSILS